MTFSLTEALQPTYVPIPQWLQELLQVINDQELTNRILSLYQVAQYYDDIRVWLEQIDKTRKDLTYQTPFSDILSYTNETSLFWSLYVAVAQRVLSVDWRIKLSESLVQLLLLSLVDGVGLYDVKQWTVEGSKVVDVLWSDKTHLVEHTLRATPYVAHVSEYTISERYELQDFVPINLTYEQVHHSKLPYLVFRTGKRLSVCILDANKFSLMHIPAHMLEQVYSDDQYVAYNLFKEQDAQVLLGWLLQSTGVEVPLLLDNHLLSDVAFIGKDSDVYRAFVDRVTAGLSTFVKLIVTDDSLPTTLGRNALDTVVQVVSDYSNTLTPYTQALFMLLYRLRPETLKPITPFLLVYAILRGLRTYNDILNVHQIVNRSDTGMQSMCQLDALAIHGNIVQSERMSQILWSYRLLRFELINSHQVRYANGVVLETQVSTTNQIEHRGSIFAYTRVLTDTGLLYTHIPDYGRLQDGSLYYSPFATILTNEPKIPIVHYTHYWYTHADRITYDYEYSVSELAYDITTEQTTEKLKPLKDLLAVQIDRHLGFIWAYTVRGDALGRFQIVYLQIPRDSTVTLVSGRIRFVNNNQEIAAYQVTPVQTYKLDAIEEFDLYAVVYEVSIPERIPMLMQKQLLETRFLQTDNDLYMVLETTAEVRYPKATLRLNTQHTLGIVWQNKLFVQPPYTEDQQVHIVYPVTLLSSDTNEIVLPTTDSCSDIYTTLDIPTMEQIQQLQNALIQSISAAVDTGNLYELSPFVRISLAQQYFAHLVKAITPRYGIDDQPISRTDTSYNPYTDHYIRYNLFA